MLDDIIAYIKEQDNSLIVFAMPETFRDELRVIVIRKRCGSKLIGVDWAISREELQRIVCKEALFQVADGYIDKIKQALANLKG